MAGINDYSNTAGSNTTINGIDIAEGCSPAGINNAIRQLMADIADVDDGVVALQTPDINGGTIDGAVIGGTTPAAGTFTTLTANTSITGTLNTAAQPNITSVGTLTSATISGDLTVDTNTLYVDSTNNRVGIGTTSPSEKLNISTKIGSQDDPDAIGLGSSYSNTAGSPSRLKVKVYDAGGDAVNGLGHSASLMNIVSGVGGHSMGFFTTPSGGSSTERMRIDSSGNVGIGTSSPSSFNFQARNLVVGTGSGANGITIYSGNTSNADIFFADGTTGDDPTRGGINYNHSSNSMNFRVNDSPKMYILSSGNVGIGTSSPSGKLDVVGDIYWGSQGNGRIFSDSNWGCILQADKVSPGVAEFNFSNASGTERMRIDSSGNLLVNRTSTLDSGKVSISYSSVGERGLCIGVDSTVTTAQVRFVNPNGGVGEITTSGTSTSYNTSSDYRLKENVNYDFDATTRLKQLKPARFNFIADANTTVDGFLAHEVQDIVPEAITGTKDEVDADGNPVYQGIDQSKLVPLLTASLKEAINKIEQLEARISALET